MRKWKPYGHFEDESAWTDLSNMMPTKYGTYITPKTFVASGLTTPTTPGTLRSVWFGTGFSTGYFGTSTKLYSFVSGVFTDRSKGGGYSSSWWNFCQYGNITLAFSSANAPQFRDITTSNAFADLSGSPPKARISVVQSNAVVVFYYDDGVTTYSDGWWASDIGDYTTWTPSASNDAAYGRILGAGAITAAVAFKQEIIVFTLKSVHRMRYVGAPFYWTVEQITNAMGADGQASVANCKDFLIFNGLQGAYRYDGVSFTRIDEGFESYPSQTINTYSAAGANWGASGQEAYYDSRDGNVYFWCAPVPTVFIYNTFSNSWGKFVPRSTAGSTLASTVVPITGDHISAYQVSGTYYRLADFSGADPYSAQSNPAPGGETNYVTSHVYGDESSMTLITRVNPIWAATSGTPWVYYGNSGYSLTVLSTTDRATAETSETAITASADSRRFDVAKTRRFFRLKISATSRNMEIADVRVDMKPSGTD